MQKLNLGCSFQKEPGYVNIDAQGACQPDVVFDLEETPWPWADNSVSEILASHILEHLGQDTKVFLRIMQEMYRVCADGARIDIRVPHPNHWTFQADPTHVRRITPDGLRLFDRQFNEESIAAGGASTPLGIYCGVDFVVEKVLSKFDEPWASRIANGVATQYDLDFAAAHYVNSIAEWTIHLRVRKPAVASQGYPA